MCSYIKSGASLPVCGPCLADLRLIFIKPFPRHKNTTKVLSQGLLKVSKYLYTFHHSFINRQEIIIMNNTTQRNQETKAKWLSVLVQPEQLKTIESIQSSFEDLGLTMPAAKVLRRFLALGFEHCRNNEMLEYPTRFFTQDIGKETSV